MYVDAFHFSPFEINKNIVSIYNGDFIIKNEKITYMGEKITPEQFYEYFFWRSNAAWFNRDFVKFYHNKKGAIPSTIAEFAVYLQAKFSFLPKDVL
jgi:hypothetical protein